LSICSIRVILTFLSEVFKLSRVGDIPMTSTRAAGSGIGNSGGNGSNEVSVTEWLTIRDQIEYECAELENELSARGLTARQKRQLTKRVNDCKDDLQRLEYSLQVYESSPVKYKIGDGEIQRRRGLLAQVRTTLQRVDEAAGGRGGAGGGGGAGWRRRANQEETGETAGQTNQQLYVQQKESMQQQDEKLDNILAGVQTLKVMSQDINQELDLHHHLLNELDDAVDETDKKIQGNTKRIDNISRREGAGWCVILCMVLLLVAIVILIATNWFCYVFQKCDKESSHDVASSTGTSGGDGDTGSERNIQGW
jgi:methyl-accepting chemotaxis protein